MYSYDSGIDQPHSVREFTGSAAGTYYFAMELPGHVSGLTNASGQLVNRYRYSPFGKLEYVQEGVPNPIRYMAREWDPDAGLYYVRNRWYDPQVGRFISEDPIGIAGGINVYAYVGNDPVNGRDPFGLAECDEERSYGYFRKSGAYYYVCVPKPDRGSGVPSGGGGGGGSPSGPGSTGGLTPGGGWGGPGNYPTNPTQVQGYCPNTTSLERVLARRADARSASSGTEEGYFVAPFGLFYTAIDGPGVTKGRNFIAARPPFWATTMIHNHPSGRGISEGDSLYAYANNVRVVSGSARTNIFGAINPGAARHTCVTPY